MAVLRPGELAGEASPGALWLVRHAQPLIEAGLCYGVLDVAAEAEATREAAQTLAGVLPQGLLVISSPLQRCELFAQVLSGLRPDLICKTDARLAEMNFGCWEGKRWDSIPKTAYEAWTADFWQHRFGGVESVADVMIRVASVWDEAALSGQAQLWVTHAGVIRAATLLAQGLRRIELMQQWPQAAPAFGQWCVL
jgi:alpha-ribazole phosphatase